MSTKPTREDCVGPDAGSQQAALWIFGYGSLVWRPEFAHLERRAAWVEGWTRRFWQGSTDHRGVPGAPGRVATLTPVARSPGSRCWGMAYRVASEHAQRVLAALDHREQGGYDRVGVLLHFSSVLRGHWGRRGAGGGDRMRGVMYVASSTNPNYLGPASLEVIARQVSASRGPSGTNLEYVQRLAGALLDLCPSLKERGEDALALARLVEDAAARKDSVEIEEEGGRS